MLIFDEQFSIDEFVQNMREMLISNKIINEKDILVGIATINCKLYYVLAKGKQLFVTDGEKISTPLEEIDYYANSDFIKIINLKSPGLKQIKELGTIKYSFCLFPLSIKQ